MLSNPVFENDYSDEPDLTIEDEMTPEGYSAMCESDFECLSEEERKEKEVFWKFEAEYADEIRALDQFHIDHMDELEASETPNYIEFVNGKIRIRKSSDAKELIEDLAIPEVIDPKKRPIELTVSYTTDFLQDNCKLGVTFTNEILAMAGTCHTYRDICTVLICMARMLYTATIPPWSLDEKLFDPAIIKAYGCIEELCGMHTGIKRISEAEVKSCVSNMGASDAVMTAVMNLRNSFENHATSSKMTKHITSEPCTEPFIRDILRIYGINLRRSYFNSKAYMGWKIVDDHFLEEMMEHFKALGMESYTKQEVNAIAQNAAGAVIWYPKAEWMRLMREKEQYDPTHDYFAELMSHFDDPEGVYAFSLRMWMHNEVKTALQGNYNVQQKILVLTGPKDIGKSGFAKWILSCMPNVNGEFSPFTIVHGKILMPPTFSDTRIDFTAQSQSYDKTRFRADFLGFEMSELEVTPKTENAFKSIITDMSSSATDKYDVHPTIRHPLCALIGTCDHLSLNKPDSHRILIFDFNPEDGFEYSKMNPMKLWVQAIYEVTHGMEYKMTKEMKAKQEAAQMSCVIESSAVTFLRAAFEPDTDNSAFYKTAIALTDINALLSKADGVEKYSKNTAEDYFGNILHLPKGRYNCYNSVAGNLKVKKQYEGFKGYRPTRDICMKYRDIFPMNLYYPVPKMASK